MQIVEREISPIDQPHDNGGDDQLGDAGGEEAALRRRFPACAPIGA